MEEQNFVGALVAMQSGTRLVCGTVDAFQTPAEGLGDVTRTAIGLSDAARSGTWDTSPVWTKDSGS